MSIIEELEDDDKYINISDDIFDGWGIKKEDIPIDIVVKDKEKGRRRLQIPSWVYFGFRTLGDSTYIRSLIRKLPTPNLRISRNIILWLPKISLRKVRMMLPFFRKKGGDPKYIEEDKKLVDSILNELENIDNIEDIS